MAERKRLFVGRSRDDQQLEIPLIRSLDLTRTPFDRLPHRRVSEYQFNTAFTQLNSFLGMSSNDISSLTSLNRVTQGLGDQIRTIIDARGHQEQIRGKSHWLVRQDLRDDETGTDTLLAYAQNDRVCVERYRKNEKKHISKYIVYVPRISQLKDHSTTPDFGLYSAHDLTQDTNRYYPEKNPLDPRDTRGYFNVLQQATRDLFEATGLSHI